jgi:hypothetical protein
MQAPLRSWALLTSLVVVGTVSIVVGSVGTAIGTPSEPSGTATKKPSGSSTKKSDIDAKPSRWGVVLGGHGKESGRLPGKGARPTPESEDGYPRKVPAQPAGESRRRAPFRLNQGICGLPAPDGGGRMGPARCEGAERLEPDEPTPSVAVRDLPQPEDVTWEQVLAETKNVAFPGLRVKVQPAVRTLVNLDTIVYTDQAKVSSTTVTLLGFPVVVEATPMSYTWRFGDGTTVTTESPGKPYPAKEITHKYLKRGSVSIALTTNYAARFNVDGTGWQYINGTVPITGPATPLQVQEAVPVLVDPPN